MLYVYLNIFFLDKGDKTQNNSNANVNRPDEALAQIIEEHINNNEPENDNNNMERLIFIENDPENQNSAVMYYYNVHYKE